MCRLVTHKVTAIVCASSIPGKFVPVLVVPVDFCNKARSLLTSWGRVWCTQDTPLLALRTEYWDLRQETWISWYLRLHWGAGETGLKKSIKNKVVMVMLNVMHLTGRNPNNRTPLFMRRGLAIISQSASPETFPPRNCGAFHCLTVMTS